MPMEEWDRVIRGQLPRRVHDAAAHGRARSSASGHGGAIVATASSAAIVADMGFVHYSMAKIAVTHMVRVAARELGPFGIRVNAVAPGPTRTADDGGHRRPARLRRSGGGQHPARRHRRGRGHRGHRARAVRAALGHRPDARRRRRRSRSRPAPTCPASPARPSPSGDDDPPPRCVENGCPTVLRISPHNAESDRAALMRAVRVVDGAPVVVQVDEPDGRAGPTPAKSCSTSARRASAGPTSATSQLGVTATLGHEFGGTVDGVRVRGRADVVVRALRAVPGRAHAALHRPTRRDRLHGRRRARRPHPAPARDPARRCPTASRPRTHASSRPRRCRGTASALAAPEPGERVVVVGGGRDRADGRRGREGAGRRGRARGAPPAPARRR